MEVCRCVDAGINGDGRVVVVHGEVGGKRLDFEMGVWYWAVTFVE